jgi:hypothetical protein
VLEILWLEGDAKNSSDLCPSELLEKEGEFDCSHSILCQDKKLREVDCSIKNFGRVSEFNYGGKHSENNYNNKDLVFDKAKFPVGVMRLGGVDKLAHPQTD